MPRQQGVQGVLNEGRPHKHVAVGIYDHSLPCALVEHQEFGRFRHRILIVYDVPGMRHHLQGTGCLFLRPARRSKIRTY